MEAQKLYRKSDPSGWSRRNRRIAVLTKSGKSLQQIGAEIGVTRERVRQIAAEIGIKAARGLAMRQMQRRLTRPELDKIKRLYEKGESLEAIGERLRLGAVRVKRLAREYDFRRKYRCRTCGKRFDRGRDGNGFFYCKPCSAEHKRQMNASYQNGLYRTDREFRRRKLSVSAAWRHSKAGKKWLAEYSKRSNKEKKKPKE